MRAILTLAFCLASFAYCSIGRAADPPIEQKVASLDAGRYVPESDLSVARARALLAAASKVYGANQARLADMAYSGVKIAAGNGLRVSVAELLDWALIGCEVTCTVAQFAENISLYVTARSSSGQTHHQAVRGLLILAHLAKRIAK